MGQKKILNFIVFSAVILLEINAASNTTTAQPRRDNGEKTFDTDSPSRTRFNRSQFERNLARLRARMAQEPTVGAVIRETLRHFRLHPEALDKLRSAAYKRALVPLVAAGYRFDDDRFVSFETQELTQPRINNLNQNRHVNAFTLGVVFDLRELVFNPAVLQVYGLVAVQRDVALDAARYFYIRKQVMISLYLRPPKDPITRESMQARIDEYSAILDVFTGGYFTRTSDQRQATPEE